MQIVNHTNIPAMVHVPLMAHCQQGKQDMPLPDCCAILHGPLHLAVQQLTKDCNKRHLCFKEWPIFRFL